MNMHLSRTPFLMGAAGIAGTTLGAFGFGEIEAAHAATIRPFKLARTVETRNTCPYCAVACGIIMYSRRPEEGRARGSCISRAIPTTRPIAARCARRARRFSISCTRRRAHNTR